MNGTDESSSIRTSTRRCHASRLIFRHVPKYPAHDGRVRYNDPSLGQHRSQVPIAQAIRDVSANTEFNCFRRKSARLMDQIACYGFSHSAPPLSEASKPHPAVSVIAAQ